MPPDAYACSDCDGLHTCWTDKLTNGFQNLHYQTFNTRTKTWNGTALRIAAATAAIKWFPHDIQVTHKGTVILGASTGARGGGTGIAGQSTVVWVKKLGATGFGRPIEVSKSNTRSVDIGRAPSLHVEGEVVHVIYRTKRSGVLTALQWGFSYRALDTATLKFRQANDVHIGRSAYESATALS